MKRFRESRLVGIRLPGGKSPASHIVAELAIAVDPDTSQTANTLTDRYTNAAGPSRRNWLSGPLFDVILGETIDLFVERIQPLGC